MTVVLVTWRSQQRGNGAGRLLQYLRAASHVSHCLPESLQCSQWCQKRVRIGSKSSFILRPRIPLTYGTRSRNSLWIRTRGTPPLRLPQPSRAYRRQGRHQTRSGGTDTQGLCIHQARHSSHTARSSCVHVQGRMGRFKGREPRAVARCHRGDTFQRLSVPVALGLGLVCP